MTPAAHQLLRALYLHALAPSAATQDAVRAAGAALDTETARALNGPRVQRSSGNVFRDLGLPDADAKFEAAKGAAVGLPCHTDALPIAEAVSRKILDRAAFGMRKYGVSLDDAGLDPAAWLLHLQEELLDGANYVESFMRAMRETPATAPVEPPQVGAVRLASIRLEARREARREALQDALAGVEALPEFVLAKPNTTTWHLYGGDAYPLTTDGVQRIFPTKDAALRWEALKAHSGEALAGSLPVYVLAGTGRHPYGDDAWHMETDGVARLFPSKEAAQRWLAAMGRAPA